MRLHSLGPSLVTQRPIDFFNFEGDNPYNGLSVIETAGATLAIADGGLGGIGNSHVVATQTLTYNNAYVSFIGDDTQPGGWAAYSTRLRVPQYSVYGIIFHVIDKIYISFGSPSRFGFVPRDDDNNFPISTFYTYGPAKIIGQNYLFAIAIKRASASDVSDGEIIWRWDGGQLHLTGIKNYITAAKNKCKVGIDYNNSTDSVLDFGDIKIGKSVKDVFL